MGWPGARLGRFFGHARCMGGARGRRAEKTGYEIGERPSEMSSGDATSEVRTCILNQNLRCITYDYFVRNLFRLQYESTPIGANLALECFRSSFTACRRRGKSRDVFWRAQLRNEEDLELIVIPPG